jgi:hypothetical protein
VSLRGGSDLRSRRGQPIPFLTVKVGIRSTECRLRPDDRSLGVRAEDTGAGRWGVVAENARQAAAERHEPLWVLGRWTTEAFARWTRQRRTAHGRLARDLPETMPRLASRARVSPHRVGPSTCGNPVERTVTCGGLRRPHGHGMQEVSRPPCSPRLAASTFLGSLLSGFVMDVVPTAPGRPAGSSIPQAR